MYNEVEAQATDVTLLLFLYTKDINGGRNNEQDN